MRRLLIVAVLVGTVAATVPAAPAPAQTRRGVGADFDPGVCLLAAILVEQFLVASGVGVAEAVVVAVGVFFQCVATPAPAASRAGAARFRDVGTPRMRAALLRAIARR